MPSKKSIMFDSEKAINSKFATINSPEFEIYREPFCNMAKRDEVMIVTYGLVYASHMKPVVDLLDGHKVTLVVGYSKHTHDLRELAFCISTYTRIGWKVFVCPKLHVKAWVIGKTAWIGSMNFVRGTAPNLMVPVPTKVVRDKLVDFLEECTAYTKGTNLELAHAPR